MCDNPAAAGGACGARAVVHEVHYKYSPLDIRRPFDADRVLTEIRYDIDCPRCGFRTQVERVEPIDNLPRVRADDSRASQPA